MKRQSDNADEVDRQEQEAKSGKKGPEYRAGGGHVLVDFLYDGERRGWLAGWPVKKGVLEGVCVW